MNLGASTSAFAGAILLGFVHGAEPGHGWPIAATYALDRRRKWLHGLLAGTLIGVGHLVSSLAVVAVIFLAKAGFGLEHLGWIRYPAGLLLIALGIHEWRSGGHHHGSEDGHDHDGHDYSHSDHQHTHDHHDDHHTERDGLVAQIGERLPFGGGHGGHGHLDASDAESLRGLVGAAFVLGFAHEEEFELMGLCLGADSCLALMTSYALAVIVALVALTLLLVAGYQRYEERIEAHVDLLPKLSAVVLVLFGLGFIAGVL
jgi:ABC-type nickel/cobalt efflux system permease component RcnA